MKRTLRIKNTLKNKKSKKSKTRKIKTNSKKKRLYLGGMDSEVTKQEELDKILDKLDFEQEYRGYRYLEAGDLSKDNISNSLTSFAATCAYILKDKPDNPYKYPVVADEYEDEMVMMAFINSNKNDFNTKILNDFVQGKSNKKFIQILKKQLNAFEHNAPYVCALRQVYKIHLQPKLEFLEYYINQLIELYKHNETLRDGIVAFKVIANYNSINEMNNLPVIVLYPKDVSSTTHILYILKNNIEYIENSSMGIVPRHNYGILNTQDILYIANGDGDIKDIIIEYGEELLNDGSDIITNVFENTPEFPNAFIKGSEFMSLL